MGTDYFTHQDFWDWLSEDPEATTKYPAEKLDPAQIETVERLETWARSAWPNVTGSDGNGTAAAVRSITDEQSTEPGTGRILLTRTPVIAVQSITHSGRVLTLGTDYTVNAAAGVISLASATWPWFKRDTWRREQGDTIEYPVEVTYTYGHTSTPFSVRRPVMMAVKSMLTGQESPTKRIPGGARRIASRGTTIDIGSTEKELVPWPWDTAASAEMRAYWSPRRAKGRVGS